MGFNADRYFGRKGWKVVARFEGATSLGRPVVVYYVKSRNHRPEIADYMCCYVDESTSTDWLGSKETLPVFGKTALAEFVKRSILIAENADQQAFAQESFSPLDWAPGEGQ